MEARWERLEELRVHLHDHKWLAAHADPIYSTLEYALNYPPQVNDAIERLIAICPYMFTRSDFKRWSSLLADALLNAQLLQDDELQSRIWAQMGESLYMTGQHSEARDAFETALEHAKQGRTNEMLLAAYTGIIKLQSTRLDASFNQEFAQEALELARQVDDLDLRARLYAELAGIHTRRSETYDAISYGQMAYAHWHKTGNQLDKARTAVMLADAHLRAGNLEQANRFLDVAVSLFTQMDYAPSYCIVAYETGVLYLYRQEYDPAEQWFRIALGEAEKIEHPYYLALSNHSLGIAQIQLKQLSEASKHLREALTIWEQLKHHYHHAHVYHALGYLEGQQGNIKQALDYLNIALGIAVELPEMPGREMLEKLIKDTIAELNEPT